MQTHSPDPPPPSRPPAYAVEAHFIDTPDCPTCHRPMRPMAVTYDAREKTVSYKCIVCAWRTTKSSRDTPML